MTLPTTSKRGIPMNENANIVLLDQPEDEFCEERGWVSCDVSVDHARWLLQDYCADEHGDVPARPVGDPKRVWLKADNSSAFKDEQRWHPCEPGEGVEFWEFDVTDAVAVKREAA